MFNIGPEKLMVVLLVALIVLGPDKLPNAARQIGRYLNDFRRISQGFQQELRTAMDLAADPVKSAGAAVMVPTPAPDDDATDATSDATDDATVPDVDTPATVDPVDDAAPNTSEPVAAEPEPEPIASGPIATEPEPEPTEPEPTESEAAAIPPDPIDIETSPPAPTIARAIPDLDPNRTASA